MIRRRSSWCRQASCFAAALLGLAACDPSTGPGGGGGSVRPPFGGPSAAYADLLAAFPESAQGLGPDASFSTTTQQPMTYGLVLMAESRHQRAAPNAESLRRLRNAADWLIDNADLDGDGKPGWGYPDPWDAFGDGSVNPADHPYTIVTALAIDGLLDAAQVPRFWDATERRGVRDLILAALLRWVAEAFTRIEGDGGYFWYSVASVDSDFCINPSAMLAGTIQRFIAEFGTELTPANRQTLQDAADRATRSVVRGAAPRDGHPYWTYLALPNHINQNEPNDVIHHGYILWGMEDYRRSGGQVTVPWSAAEALGSLAPFFLRDTIFEYPHDVEYADALHRDRPARLWGAGTLVAVLSRFGDRPRATEAYRVVEERYGPAPYFRKFPAWYTDDPAFYPRMASHLLLGLAERDFSGAIR